MDQASAYGRAVFAGIRRRMVPRIDCRLLVGEPRPEVWAGFAAAGVEAAIVHAQDAALVAAVRRWGGPAVAVGNRVPCELPRCGVDDAAVGAMAADFLLARGARSFVVVGREASRYTVERHAGFAARVREAGHACRWLEWDDDLRRVVGPLAALPAPVAVLVAMEEPAVRVVAACVDAGLELPGRIQVVSGTDDPVICTLGRPTVTAVRFDAECIGDEAAGLLLGLASGAAPSPSPLLLQPTHVVERGSTAAAADRDPAVAAALAWLQAHATERVGVDDLVRALGGGRRQLERRFTALVGRSIYQHLLALRLERAKELLRSGDPGLNGVAAACGFAGARHLCEAFRQREGLSPGAWREANRGDPPAGGPVARPVRRRPG
jgi:LacI family transcriptional regulator